MQPVTMSVKTRQGRKTITHISGLETFSVDVDEFAEVLRKLCAGSASGELSDSCIWELS
jgi:translation initiation factor 2D